MTERSRASLLDRLLNAVPAIVLLYIILVNPLLMEGATSGSAENNVTAAQPNRFNQLFWLMLFAATVAAAGHRIFAFLHGLSRPVVLLVAAYLLLAFASVAWSPVPGIALRRIILQTIFVLVLAIPILLSRDSRGLIGGLLGVFAFAVWLNVAAVMIVPPSPIGHVGIYSQKNTLGVIMAGAFLFLAYGFFTEKRARRWFFLVTALAAFALLLMSSSKTSLALAVLTPVISATVLGLSNVLRISPVIVLVFMGALGLVGWFFFSLSSQFGFADLSILLFDDETFTGRTTIWAFSIDAISRSPLLGHGYASFWATGTDSIVFREAPGFVASLLQSHSGYIDVWVETGVIGFALLVLLLACTILQISRLGPTAPGLAWLCLTVVLFAVIHNTMETSWFRGFSFLWMQFLLVAFLSAKPIMKTP